MNEKGCNVSSWMHTAQELLKLYNYSMLNGKRIINYNQNKIIEQTLLQIFDWLDLIDFNH